MHINWIAVLTSAFIPLAIATIWYHPKIFGKAWMDVNGLTEEDLKKTNRYLRIGISFVCCFLISAMLMPVVIHQIHVFSIMQHASDFGKEGSATTLWLAGFMGEHGDYFRTFRHGVLHGAILGIFFVLPVATINALLEGKRLKYIAIKVGYWIVSLMLMGGVISAWK